MSKRPVSWEDGFRLGNQLAVDESLLADAAHNRPCLLQILGNVLFGAHQKEENEDGFRLSEKREAFVVAWIGDRRVKDFHGEVESGLRREKAAIQEYDNMSRELESYSLYGGKDQRE